MEDIYKSTPIGRALKVANFISILVDRSTDCSVVEKELIFVMYVALGKLGNARETYIDSLLHCLQGRFDEMQQNSAFKGIKLLDMRCGPLLLLQNNPLLF